MELGGYSRKNCDGENPHHARPSLPKMIPYRFTQLHAHYLDGRSMDRIDVLQRFSGRNFIPQIMIGNFTELNLGSGHLLLRGAFFEILILVQKNKLPDSLSQFLENLTTSPLAAREKGNPFLANCNSPLRRMKETSTSPSSFAEKKPHLPIPQFLQPQHFPINPTIR